MTPDAPMHGCPTREEWERARRAEIRARRLEAVRVARTWRESLIGFSKAMPSQLVLGAVVVIMKYLVEKMPSLKSGPAPIMGAAQKGIQAGQLPAPSIASSVDGLPYK